MSAVEETSSKHIKSVVILSLNTLFFLILILKQRYLQFFVVILKNVENKLKRESWHKLFSLKKKPTYTYKHPKLLDNNLIIIIAML